MITATGTIVVCAATSWEANPLARNLRLTAQSSEIFSGTTGKTNLCLLKTGLGGGKAARALGSLPAAEIFSCVVSSGFAGSLNADIKPGNIIIDIPETHPSWRQAAEKSAQKTRAQIRFGQVISTERVSTPAQKKALGRASGAYAVDMETAAVREWAKTRNVPAMAVRVVLDGIDDELPMGDDVASILGFAAANAGRLGRLVSLGLRQRRAMTTLAKFLQEFLPCL